MESGPDSSPPTPKPDPLAEQATSKLMQTFRMQRELVAFLRAEADRGGRDLTHYVTRCLEGVRTYFGLPAAASAQLEADRSALGMGRLEYLQHVLYQRALLVREKGPGLDGPGAAGPRASGDRTG